MNKGNFVQLMIMRIKDKGEGMFLCMIHELISRRIDSHIQH